MGLQTVPTAIWGRADGDVRLWVPLIGNVSDDISPYALGTGTNTGVTLSGDAIPVNGSVFQNIAYGSSAVLGISTGQAYTLECFVTWTSSDFSTQPGDFFSITVGSSSTFYVGCYANTGQIALHEASTQSSTSGNVLAGATKLHIAMVRPAGTGPQTRSVYAGGTRVITYTEIAEPIGTNGTVKIGKVTTGIASVYNIYDFRYTKRALYSGSSFTPPTYPL